MVFFAHDQRVISQSSWIILWIYSSSLNSGTVSARASGRKMWAECTESVSSWRWELFALKLSESIQRWFLSFFSKEKKGDKFDRNCKNYVSLLPLSELLVSKMAGSSQCCHSVILAVVSLLSWCPFRLAQFGPTAGWWGNIPATPYYSNTWTRHPIVPQSHPTLS